MTNKEYEDFCKSITSTEFNKDLISEDLIHSAIGCVTEAGELIDVVKKTLFYGREVDIPNIIEEYGDQLFYIAMGLHSIGSSIDEAIAVNHAKLSKRYDGGFTTDKAINRDLETENDIIQNSIEKGSD